ncbi:hypothetical protein [Mesorhizobium sp. YM1C-6-2]|uniref:hypothetical protein n=1 Tax=Mesorhizobium sp. YM1C-6-2 TaxID=1827501 RepID=UPI0016026626|nr:hypothetical protein [Mesorhizobium sp. YM1C-6-2]
MAAATSISEDFFALYTTMIAAAAPASKYTAAMVARICPRNDIERQLESKGRHSPRVEGGATGWPVMLSNID